MKRLVTMLVLCGFAAQAGASEPGRVRLVGPYLALARPYAQRTAGPDPREVHSRDLDDEASVPRMVMGGIGGMAIGLVGGVFMGAGLANCDSGDEDGFCTLGYAAMGAAVTMSVTTPVGVHLADHRRGNLLLDIGVSTAAAALGVGAAFATGDSGPLLAVPVLQLIGAVVAEHQSGSHRH